MLIHDFIPLGATEAQETWRWVFKSISPHFLSMEGSRIYLQMLSIQPHTHIHTHVQMLNSWHKINVKIIWHKIVNET